MSVFEVTVNGTYPATSATADYQILYNYNGKLTYTALSGWYDAATWNDGSVTIAAQNSFYQNDAGEWVQFTMDDTITESSVVAQSVSTDYGSYYASGVISAGNVPYAYTSNAFDSMQTTSVLSEVYLLLPIVLVVLAGYIAVRKGIDFIRSRLRTA